MRIDGLMNDAETLLLELITKLQFVRLVFRELNVEFGDQTELRELLIAVGRQFGVVVVGSRPGPRRPAYRKWCFAD